MLTWSILHEYGLGRQAIIGSKSAPKILEELGKVPSYTIDCQVLQEGALSVSGGSHSQVSVRLTIKSTFAPCMS